MRITINVFWLIIPALAGLGLLLVSEHRQHLLDFLPFLLLRACPLLHIFAHHGHSHGAHDRQSG